MPDLLLTVFRYIFLALLYFFIFQLIKMMFQDLKAGGHDPATAGKKSPGGQPDKPPEDEPPEIKVVPPPGVQAGLVVLTSGDPGLTPGSILSLQRELTFGRGTVNAVTLADPFASTEHAAVYGKDGQYWLEDRGSKNGTFLNGVRIGKTTVLADGDRIRIGGVNLQFVRWAYEVESNDGSGPCKEKKRG